MYWVLTSTSDDAKDLSWSLASGSLLMGRALDCHIVIHDPTVSRKHCRISVDNDRVLLSDLGSRHPAEVNGQPTLSKELKEGDVISLGSTSFMLSRVNKNSTENKFARFDITTCSLATGSPNRYPHHASEKSMSVRERVLNESATPTRTDLLGESKVMVQVREQLQDTAATDLNVLVTGETGTGKELAAQMLHQGSRRAHKPLVSMNCAAIPDHLFESELFGHEKGSFTGADKKRKGRFAMAHGGTLFFDEIGDLSLENQARLLRTLETGNYYPVGSDTECHADVRVIAATHRDLRRSIREEKFREDLYHRICTVEIALPALRQRPTDIPLLANYFVRKFSPTPAALQPSLTEEALSYLQALPWSGNVRELRNAIERATALAKTPQITPNNFTFLNNLLREDAENRYTTATATAPAKALADLERQHIVHVLEQCNFNVSKAARELGIHRNTLHNKIAEYGIKG